MLILVERPTRSALEAEERLGLGGRDPGTRFLRALLVEARIPPEEIVVGAAMLCRPRRHEDERGSVVTSIRECREHLRELVAIVQPRLIVPLGAQALRSMREAFASEPPIAKLRFPECVGHTVSHGGTHVHPLYHTTVRARVTRKEGQQRRDWRALGRVWQWIEGGERGSAPRGRRRADS